MKFWGKYIARQDQFVEKVEIKILKMMNKNKLKKGWESVIGSRTIIDFKGFELWTNKSWHYRVSIIAMM